MSTVDQAPPTDSVVPMGPVDYAAAVPPSLYRCTTCGAFGCKLWREYQTFANHTELVCCDCAGRSQKKDMSDIDAEGRRMSFYRLTRRQRRYRARHGTVGRRGARMVPAQEPSGRTDQIGWRVPAVPTEDGEGFWGYSSVPDDGVKWWRALPTRQVRP